jgi:hypothetical protein
MLGRERERKFGDSGRYIVWFDDSGNTCFGLVVRGDTSFGLVIGEIHRLTTKEKIIFSLICGPNHKLDEAEFGTSVLRLSKSSGSSCSSM